MLQPKNITDNNVKIFDGKIKLSDVIFIITTVVFSFGLGTIAYPFKGWIATLIISVFISVLILTFGMTKLSDKRNYRVALSAISFWFSKKHLKVTDLQYALPVSNIDQNGVIIWKDNLYYLVEIKGFDIWKFSDAEIASYQRKLHAFLANNFDAIKFLKVNMNQNLLANINNLKTSFARLSPEQQKQSYYNNYYSNAYQELKRFERDQNTLKYSYFFMVQIPKNYTHYDFYHKLKHSLQAIKNLDPQIITSQEDIANVFSNLFRAPIKLDKDIVSFDSGDWIIAKDHIKSKTELLSISAFEELPILLQDEFLRDYFSNKYSNFIVDLHALSHENTVKAFDKATRILNYKQFNSLSIVESHQLNSEEQALEEYIAEFNKYQTRLYKASFIEITYAMDDKSFKDALVIQEQINKRFQISQSPKQYRQLNNLKTLFEQNGSFYDKYTTTFSLLNIARSWPWTSEYFNDHDYFILGSQAYANGLLFFDDMKKTAKRPSSSIFFIGETGSGKTASR
ncbi:hypothetical protein [Mycoplasmopsis sturni]|uniref:hypothetical protein n=1 Tax=Mycoplasmopsis sturni TaxID=39047 RepID=UPI000559BD1E|nr:hypothetical protein [Mycoplasmopsis sturni]